MTAQNSLPLPTENPYSITDEERASPEWAHIAGTRGGAPTVGGWAAEADRLFRERHPLEEDRTPAISPEDRLDGSGDFVADVTPAERATPEWSELLRGYTGTPGIGRSVAIARADQAFRHHWPRHPSGLTDLSRRQRPWLDRYDQGIAAGLTGPEASTEADEWYLQALGPYNLPRAAREKILRQKTIPGAGLPKFAPEAVAPEAPGKKRRGRPPGSKTKKPAVVIGGSALLDAAANLPAFGVATEAALAAPPAPPSPAVPVMRGGPRPALCCACGNARDNPIHVDGGKHGHAFETAEEGLARAAKELPELAEAVRDGYPASNGLGPKETWETKRSGRGPGVDPAEAAYRDAERAVGPMREILELLNPALRLRVFEAAELQLSAENAFKLIRKELL